MLGHPIRRPARAAALAAVAALALTACGSDDTDAAKGGSSARAATVGDEEITVGDVQRTTRELTAFVSAQAQASGQEPQQLDASTVVTYLVQTPAVLAYADEEGLDVPSQGTVRREIESFVPNPSDMTVDFLRANDVASKLDEQAQQDLSQLLQEGDVSVSPRYASAVGRAPDWLEQPESEQQTGAGQPQTP